MFIIKFKFSTKYGYLMILMTLEGKLHFDALSAKNKDEITQLTLRSYIRVSHDEDNFYHDQLILSTTSLFNFSQGLVLNSLL